LRPVFCKELDYHAVFSVPQSSKPRIFSLLLHERRLYLGNLKPASRHSVCPVFACKQQEKMKKQELYDRVIAYFEQAIPVAETELHYHDPFQLLVAVILSAQCTDKRVNMITPPLFRDYPTPEAMAAATPETIYEYIRSVSYPNNKAKHLVGMARMLVENYHSEVPSDLDELVKLPGVGRKTANVIQAVVFEKAAMAVDTHVFRVSHRIGLVPDTCTTPYSVEKQLVRYFPDPIIPKAHHWLILHGRYTCTARTPKCEACGLKMICRHYLRTHGAARPSTQS